MSNVSRRQFLRGSGTAGATALFANPLVIVSSAEKNAGPKVLDYQEWQTVLAITGRLIPTDQEPGALEAGCVNFIDRALAKEEKRSALLYHQALKEIHRLIRQRHGIPFADLTIELQDKFLDEMERGKVFGWQLQDVPPQVFFKVILTHTIFGFLSDPKYGGNRNYVGWQVSAFPGHVHMLGGVTAEQMQGRKKVRAAWGGEI